MSDQGSNYRQIVKATSIFGGVQLIQIIVQIVRSKIIAVLLGPAGMGINSLFISTLQLIGGITNFGLKSSAVKNVAEANGSGNETRVSVIIRVLRRWVWITGFFGVILTVFLSSWLSKITFGNTDYRLAIIWLSISLLFNQLSDGQLVVLQGLRKIKYLANANLTGSFLGLFISLPLYYFFEIDGIVPAIIITSIANMVRSWYFARKVKIEEINISWKTTVSEGKDMLTMGFLLSVSGLMVMGGAYLLRIFISNHGGIDQVGLYSAGFAIVNTYVGMIFTAMATDYYPRLSAVAYDNAKATKSINQQAEITILIIAPILCIFIIFINWAIVLLYSSKFLAVNEMIQWAAIGIFFKSVSWCIGFIFLAKGASKIFFLNELFSNIYFLGLNILGYSILGLSGLGISFVIAFLLHFIQIYFVARVKYQFFLERKFILIYSIQLLIGVLCFCIAYFCSKQTSYILGSFIIVLSSLYSLVELNKRIDIKLIIGKLFNK